MTIGGKQVKCRTTTNDAYHASLTFSEVRDKERHDDDDYADIDDNNDGYNDDDNDDIDNVDDNDTDNDDNVTS